MWSMCSFLRKPWRVYRGRRVHSLHTANTLQTPPLHLPPSIATYLAVVPQISFSLLPLAPHHLAFPLPLPLPLFPFTNWMLFFLFYSNEKLQPSLLPSPASHQHPILCCLKSPGTELARPGLCSEDTGGVAGRKSGEEQMVFHYLGEGKRREAGNVCPFVICALG